MLNDESAFPFPQLRQAIQANPMMSIDDFKESPNEIIHNNGMLIGALISPDLYNLVTHCSVNTINDPLFVATNHFVFKVRVWIKSVQQFDNNFENDHSLISLFQRGSRLKRKVDQFLIENQVPIQQLYRKYEQLMDSLHSNCAIKERKVKSKFGRCFSNIECWI